ncbi:type II toxin-antitoxin system RelB/DinJ family antitoxin [Yersinia enterocolitica]|uniref:Putative antitoxin n=1 Tax=Yersinia enterocolitica TaxID=630 RepID=F2Q7Y2_YEREN|nr:putative antitoxin [Yersinia enterocolitica]
MSTIQIRVDDGLKKSAYQAFEKLNQSPSDALSLFQRYVAENEILSDTLAHKVAMSGQSIRFITAADMMLQLVAAHRQGDSQGIFRALRQQAAAAGD